MTWCVYFISYGDKVYSPVKVGYTSDIDDRMINLQVCCPYKLKLIMTVPCDDRPSARRLENFLHSKLKGCRLQGEWFKWDKCRKIIPAVLDEYFNQREDVDQYIADYRMKRKRLTKEGKVVKQQTQEIKELKSQVQELEQSIDEMLDRPHLLQISTYLD